MTGIEHPAAHAVRDKTYGELNDWFLPSKDELNMMYVNLLSGTDENSDAYTPVGGFASGGYWSSSESDSTNAWYQVFPRGNQYSGEKDLTIRVRAVRAF